MADKRMFSLQIIDSDIFLDMPTSTQALYFHLAMRADDDGFISNPKKIQRMINATDDDAKLLMAKKFIILFETGIIVIKHWKQHNYIRKDRYKKTIYKNEMDMLTENENKTYVLLSENSIIDDEKRLTSGQPTVDGRLTDGCQVVDRRLTDGCQVVDRRSTNGRQMVDRRLTDGCQVVDGRLTDGQPNSQTPIKRGCQVVDKNGRPMVDSWLTDGQPRLGQTRLEEIREELLLEHGNKFKQSGSSSFDLEKYLEAWIKEKSRNKNNPSSYGASLRIKYEDGEESILDEFKRWVSLKIQNDFDKKTKKLMKSLVGYKLQTNQGMKEISNICSQDNIYKVSFRDGNFAEIENLQEFKELLEKQNEKEMQ